MHIRTIAATAAVPALLLALTACGSDSGDSKNGNIRVSASASGALSKAPKDLSKALKDAGFPDKPTGAKRTALLAALEAVDAAIVTDEDKAIDAARNQCQALHNGSAKPDWTAAQRFGSDQHPLTNAKGKAINLALKKTLCP